MNSDLDHFVVYCTKQRPQVANDSEILRVVLHKTSPSILSHQLFHYYNSVPTHHLLYCTVPKPHWMGGCSSVT